MKQGYVNGWDIRSTTVTSETPVAKKLVAIDEPYKPLQSEDLMPAA